MSTPETSFKSLPVFVTNDSSTSSSLPDSFLAHTKWRVANIVDPGSNYTVEILEVKGAWALCNITNLGETTHNDSWLYIPGISGYTWTEVK